MIANDYEFNWDNKKYIALSIISIYFFASSLASSSNFFNSIPSNHVPFFPTPFQLHILHCQLFPQDPTTNLNSYY